MPEAGQSKTQPPDPVSSSRNGAGRLATGVAQELRVAVANIQATLDAFEAQHRNDEEHSRYFRLLRQELERLASLMDGLRQLADPICRPQAVEPLDGLVSQAISATKALAEQSRVEVVSRVAPGLLAGPLDPIRMVDAFCLLLEGAIRRSPSPGQVLVTAQTVREGGQAWIACTIRDTGPPLRLEDLPGAFEPFHDLAGPTPLALSIAARIIEAHGGSAQAASDADSLEMALTVRLPAVQTLDGSSSR